MNNQVNFAGRVGQEPQEIQLTDAEKSLAKFSLAVKTFDDDEVMWLDVEAWNGNSLRVMNLITKGREVVISGRMRINKYVDKDGIPHEKPVVVLNSFYLCGAKPKPQEETTGRRRRGGSKADQ